VLCSDAKPCFAVCFLQHAQALVSLDQIPVEQLRPEFRQGVASLLQLIFAKVRRPLGGTEPLSRQYLVHSCGQLTKPANIMLNPLPTIYEYNQSAIVERHSRNTRSCRPLTRMPACCRPQAQPRPYGNLGVMSGPLLAGLTCAYVQAINQGAVPTIATAWQVRSG
jgi:hypothetical protein